MLASFVVVGTGFAMLMSSTATQKQHEASIHAAQRRYLAQTGIAESLAAMTLGGTGNLGTAQTPVARGAGGYRVTVTDLGAGTLSLQSVGRVGSSSRAMRSVVRETTQSVFFHAMFAGNSSGSSTYALSFGGTGTSSDDIQGDIYSGGAISRSGSAVLNGVLRAKRTISGATGYTGVDQVPPDLAAMNYAVRHDVNVAAEFAAHSTYVTNTSLGGKGYQVPESNPAHIFRMNPTDRKTDYQSTAKNDYFLEDPWEVVNSNLTPTVANSTRISLSGINGEPGASGNRKVYYIDGNLWIHNLNLYNFVIHHNEANGVQVTFVVKGNVYFSDNIVLKSTTKDGIAFIALKDGAVADSGNIYFGDPVFGTLEKMQAFMYAEGDFHDKNLNTSGSARIEVDGMMSAGNFVKIDRDTSNRRSKLVLRFDPRVRDGTLSLPGTPGTGGGTIRRTFQVLSEFEVPSGE